MEKKLLIKENGAGNFNYLEKHSYSVLVLILIITASVFSGSLKLEWTNWDDNLYVYGNKSVTEGVLKNIITLPADPADYNTYSPLVISSFALEWKLVQGKPFLYHLDNFLLHLFCTALALFFFRRMGLSLWWSGFAALLFGIHPMRVESVAWITERKDLLYTLFYLASLLAYIRYIASGRMAHCVLAFVFFILSLYSKVQAITLPFVLMLLDWYFKREIGWKVITEKLFFFTGALIIGVSFAVGVGYLFKKPGSIDFTNIISFIKQIPLSIYACSVYVVKSVFPYVNSVLYPLPASLHTEHWLGAAAAISMLLIALAVWRKYGFITFGALFFTLNVFLLPFASAVGESTFLNDRYTYVAYIGLFFVIAMAMQRLSEGFPSLRLPAVGIAVTLLLIFGVMTVKYIPVWKNSGTLWTHVIEKYPRQIPLAYINRAQYWYHDNRPDKAVEDLNTAIEINPNYFQPYMNRGLIYLQKNNIGNALQDYNRCLDLMLHYDTGGNVSNSNISAALGNRGLIYFKMGQYEKALVDYDLAIKLNPSNPVIYLNRALAYEKLGRIIEAKRDVQTIEQMGAVMDPSFKKILQSR